MKRLLQAALLAAVNTAVLAAPSPGTRLSFVACPIIRDTRSVPCWLSEYEGQLYYLTIQSDVSAPVQPPMLGHQVLVEGVVSDAAPICGGVVLSEVNLSVMPERDANCNTLLPADERYVIDFNPRPPGPSSGRLAFGGQARAGGVEPDRPRRQAAPPSGEQMIDIHFDFDRGVSFRHPSDLSGVLARARQVDARQARVIGHRGAHRLSNGTLLRDVLRFAQRRADEIASLLAGAGLTIPIQKEVRDTVDEADGFEDWRSRRVTVVLTP
jgi:hypothetical protein